MAQKNTHIRTRSGAGTNPRARLAGAIEISIPATATISGIDSHAWRIIHKTATCKKTDIGAPVYVG